MYDSAGLSFDFVHRYSIDVPILVVCAGSILNDVNSLEKIFLFILISIFSITFPELTFVIVSVFISNPDLSSISVIPFFSPRYSVPSIDFSPLLVWNCEFIMYTPADVFASFDGLTCTGIMYFSFGFRSNVVVMSKRIEENVAVMFLRYTDSLFFT